MTPSISPPPEVVHVLDLTGVARSTSIVVDWSPAYEILSAVTALRQGDEQFATYDLGAAWYEQLRGRVSPELEAELELITPNECKGISFLFGLVHRSPHHQDVDAVIDDLAGAPGAEMYRAMVRALLREIGQPASARLLESAVRGGAADRAALVDWIREHGGEDVPGLRALVEQEPDQLRDRVVRVLRGFRELLADHLTLVTPVLERDAAALAERMHGLDVATAVEVGTNGIVYTPEPGIRTVVLIPQVAMRPWVCIADDEAMKIFEVAVSEESLAAGSEHPPTRLVAMCKALGEEQRLRILRRLIAGPASLQQIAEHLGVAKSTAHHHLVALRAAGLIVVQLGADREYAVRSGIVDELAALLGGYLGEART
jgi:DNA-binding transcriptional ArsR family regulator